MSDHSLNSTWAEQLCQSLKDQGHLDARVLPDGSVAGLIDLLFTRAIILGCCATGWTRRFCFEDRALATQRFKELCSEDDEPTGYIARR